MVRRKKISNTECKSHSGGIFRNRLRRLRAPGIAADYWF